VVASYDKGALVTDGKLKSTDGSYGLRFAHNTEVLVTGAAVFCRSTGRPGGKRRDVCANAGVLADPASYTTLSPVTPRYRGRLVLVLLVVLAAFTGQLAGFAAARATQVTKARAGSQGSVGAARP
jgi:hypothetical protein